MENLLISESPLVVQPTLAVKLHSVDKAIILQQIHYWVSKNGKEKDGHKWIYNSVHDWAIQFPWLGEKTVQRYLKSLEDQGLLITANYNKYKFDRTKWYAIDYDALDKLGSADAQTDKKQRDSQSPSKGTDKTEPMGLSDPTYTRDYTETTHKTTSSSNPSKSKPPHDPFELQFKSKQEEEDYIKKLINEFDQKTQASMSQAEITRVYRLIKSMGVNAANEVIETVEESISPHVHDPTAYLIRALLNSIAKVIVANPTRIEEGETFGKTEH